MKLMKNQEDFTDFPDTLSVNDLCKGDFISTASCVVKNKFIR